MLKGIPADVGSERRTTPNLSAIQFSCPSLRPWAGSFICLVPGPGVSRLSGRFVGSVSAAGDEQLKVI